MSTVMRYKGYDAESVYERISLRENPRQDILPVIPVGRGGEDTDGSIKDKYGKTMRREFDIIICSQRDKTEAMSSVISSVGPRANGVLVSERQN